MCYYSCPNVHYLVTLCIYYLSVLYVHLNLLHCIFCFCTLPLLYFINMLILPNQIKSNEITSPMIARRQTLALWREINMHAAYCTYKTQTVETDFITQLNVLLPDTSEGMPQQLYRHDHRATRQP